MIHLLPPVCRKNLELYIIPYPRGRDRSPIDHIDHSSSKTPLTLSPIARPRSTSPTSLAATTHIAALNLTSRDPSARPPVRLLRSQAFLCWSSLIHESLSNRSNWRPISKRISFIPLDLISELEYNHIFHSKPIVH